MNKGWHKTRAQVLERDNYICQTCLKSFEQLTAHHVIPRDKQGSDSLDNLTTVCYTCHGIIETSEGYRTGEMIPSTNIRIKLTTKDELDSLPLGKLSYDEIIHKLIEFYKSKSS